MSDAHRRYRAIERCMPVPPRGHRQRHFTTLVAMICGLVGGHCAHLATIADHAPARTAAQESLIMRFRRWLSHNRQTLDHWFLPVSSTAGPPGPAAAHAGHGWQCRRSWLCDLNAQCGLSWPTTPRL